MIEEIVLIAIDAHEQLKNGGKIHCQSSLKSLPVGRTRGREKCAQPRQQSIQRKLGLAFQPSRRWGLNHLSSLERKRSQLYP